MAIDINVPSQVKTYANLAAFPATGSLKTIFIAEDTNKTYRWTGSAYVEISATAASTWGAIGGTLSSQTDLNTALSGKVPTTRTLTINGTTQDLSADRTFTISTGITIGTTAITSGTVGRVLFEGTGNVVQESASFSWDNTNNALSLISNANLGASALSGLIVTNTNASGYANTLWYNNLNDVGQFMMTGSTAVGFTGTNILTRQANFINAAGTGGINLLATAGNITFNAGGGTVSKVTMFTTGNVAINTTTDAGYKFDVNGTARTKYLTIESANTFDAIQFKSNTGINGYLATDGGGAYFASGAGVSGSYLKVASSNITVNAVQNTIFLNNATEVARFTNSTRNLLIGTTTDVASSLVTMNSTTKGFLPPRMTTTQKNAIATPASGLMVYDTTLNVITYYNGTSWI